MQRIKEKIESLEDNCPTWDKIAEKRLEECGLSNITLRPYQLEGVNWLIERYKRKHGCILGDEMGLGKTCQTIAFLTYLIGSGEIEGKGLHLVLCPLSVLANWQNEFKKFSPNLKVLSYVGNKDDRPHLQKKLRKSSEICVVLSTYEICLKDAGFLQKFQWSTLVVDEAHRLKNKDSLLHQSLREFDIDHIVLLTGTPVQNNLAELYSLLFFVAPKIFREKYIEAFIDDFDDTDINSSGLHKILLPFLIRRVKSEVVKDLPKKSEVVLYHGLSAIQKKYYKAILMKDTEVFENESRPTKNRLMNVLMQLRKCVNHPYLFDGVEPEPFQLGEHLVEASGKLVIIDQLLSHLKENGHKVLMFSQMTRMLDILQDYLGYRGYSYERLDGSVRGEERYLAIQNFNQDDDTFIFLLSTKAGGQGLNLVAADTIIFVDSDFNPQNDLQAAARAHRIGQTRPVKVVRLIGQSTVEEIVLRRAEAKLKLTEAVIESGQFSLGVDKDKSSLIADDNMKIQDILKFGVDKLFADDDSSVTDVDFENILGTSEDGAWTESHPKPSQSIEPMETEEKEVTESLYVFEGTDYSKEPTASDKKMFDDLIAAEKAILIDEAGGDGTRALRKSRSLTVARFMAELPTRKPKKVLTPEERLERAKKKEENAARRAKEAEEAEIKRAQAARKRREETWRANSYESLNLALASDGESEEEEEEEVEEEEDQERLDIDYVVGDVTHPQKTGSKDAIVVHCVDDSGKWGVGGLFTALSNRSAQPEEQYEMAGQMKDLALGDTHLIPIDDKDSRENGHDFVALIVAQHRDRKNNLSGIKLSALAQGLERLQHVAKSKNASVHLPRIGHSTRGFNWYGTERLIRKLLASKGIHTHIYYYPRRQKMKRKPSNDKTSSSKKSRHSLSSDEEATSTNGVKQSSPQGDRSGSPTPGPSTTLPTPILQRVRSGSPLPTFMSGTKVHFHQVPESVEKKQRLNLCAYDGDVHDEVTDDTTHIVTVADLPDKQALEDYHTDYAGQIKMVTTSWLDDCFSEKQFLGTKKYTIDLDLDD